MKKNVSILIAVLFVQLTWAQKFVSEEVYVSSYDSLKLSGTLLMPKKNQDKLILAVIIAGSGPTDRDGNNGMMNNNSLKFLAENLTNNKIATFRYDKRAVGKSLSSKIKEENLRFDHYINDIVAVVDFFKSDNRFSSIVIIGHSEGSLLGMIAAKRSKVDKYISVAGVGQSADKILKEQLYKQYKINNISLLLDSLKNGHTVKNLGKLKTLFRPSVQPYMISWFRYNPEEEIKELSCPILIIQGDNDIQVEVKEARLLKQASTQAELIIIPQMNHILKIVKGDFNENLKSYYNSDISVSKELINKLTKFILSNH